MPQPSDRRVHASTRFAALHRWPDAPDSHAYLRTSHRHLFHVTVEVSVFHDDRDVEFIALKELVEDEIENLRDWSGPEAEPMNVGTLSCENMANFFAERLVDHGLDVKAVTVSEDGENGATLYFP